MSATSTSALEPLIKRRIFDTEEEAIHELLQEYVLRHITALRQQLDRFEQEYGMRFQQFNDYLHERSGFLDRDDLSAHQRQVLGQAIMQEEDDWLDWKVAREMLGSVDIWGIIPICQKSHYQMISGQRF